MEEFDITIPEKSVDTNADMLDNGSNNADAYTPGTVFKVDRRTLKPLNNPDCKHDYYHDKDDPDSGWARVIKCRNCPVGYLESLQ